MTDPLRLRQALINLLSNALKYTDEGNISLRVWSKQEDESEQLDIYFQVKDTGIGIESEEMADIFEPFVRADNSEGKIVGAGLGLAIVWNIAQILGGDIETESEPGRGSKFRLRIACDAVCDTTGAPAKNLGSSAISTGDQEVVPNQLVGRVIHVVEDSLSIAALIRFLLEEAGAEVWHSPDGLKGVSHVLESRDRGILPDLIIMDMQMPIKDGYTAATELRQEGIEVPIVAMTAAAFTDDRDKCLAAGCDAFLSKPINPASFIQQISDCMT